MNIKNMSKKTFNLPGGETAVRELLEGVHKEDADGNSIGYYKLTYPGGMLKGTIDEIQKRVDELLAVVPADYADDLPG